MSILNGIFTSSDGSEVRLSSIDEVSALITVGSSDHYKIFYSGGHEAISESYMARVTFLASWRAA